ncbi:MAG: alpha-ketoacid dehydrogenase subunit beta, partial [Chloroflexi bacterium]|nr:alpha-ketoacid dehydrogenase subunit beta [Chloroflexota bacterium]
AELEKEGISLEVIDLRTLVPWDKETVIESVKKTHKVIIAHETWRRAGWGAEVAATIYEEAFEYLDAPIKRIGAKNVPHPFSPPLEDAVIPHKEDIIEAAKEILSF